MDYPRAQPKELDLPPRLPLVAPPNQRGAAADRDARLINAYIEQTDDGQIHVVKRPGLTLKRTIAGTRYGVGLLGPLSFWVVPGGGPNYTFDFYTEGTLISSGVASYSVSSTTDPLLRRPVWGEDVTVDTTGRLYFFHNSYLAWSYSTGLRTVYLEGTAQGPLTCGITITSPTVTMADTTLVTKYSSVTGTGIPAGTTILSVDSPTQITLDQNATATNAAASLTFTLAGPYGTLSPYYGGAYGPPAPPTRGLVGGIADLNTAIYVMGFNAAISNSDPADPYAWEPTAFLYAYAEQDQPMFIAKQLSYIVAFKSTTTEFFRDAGRTPGSPLERLDGMRLDVGAVNYRSVVEADGAIFWVSITSSGMKSAWILEGGRPREVASAAIRRALEPLTPHHVFAISVSGHTFFLVTDPTLGLTLVFDKSTGFWSYWSAFGLTYFPFAASTYEAGETLLQHISNGGIYVMDPDVTTDAGTAIVMDIFPPEFDANTRVTKYLSSMLFVGDQEAGSRLLVRVNDHNREVGRWTNFREVDLGSPRPVLENCGSFVKRAFHFRHSGSQRCRLQLVELELLLGVI